MVSVCCDAITEPKSPIVLIVDDEPALRMVTSDALEEAGLEVVQADCAQSALDILKTRADVSVLFTDVNMPGSLDGLDLAALVHESWPTIRLVVTSGRALAAPIPDGQCMAKPYRLAEMTNLIARAASGDD